MPTAEDVYAVVARYDSSSFCFFSWRVWSDEPGLALGPSRERVSNTWVTCPDDRDNPRKLGLIPDVVYTFKCVH
jgi:hypothetical protein